MEGWNLKGLWDSSLDLAGRDGHGGVRRWRETVHLWDPEAGAEVATLRGEGAKFFRVCFSPDGRYVAAVARGGALHLWEADPETTDGGAAR